MNFTGKTLTEKVRAFNDWRDDILIDLSTLLLMIGFVMGTFDILTRIGIATEPTFTSLWAAVQAIAIDGLFFAVWAKVARTSWAKGYRLKSLALVFVGLLLAFVAILVNAVLSYQQLTGIADSVQAMALLHISSIVFVWARAILVVTVALLVQLFCRGKVGDTMRDSPPLPPVSVAISEEHSPDVRSPRRAKPTMPVAIAEHASITHSLDDVATDSPAPDSPVATSDPSDSPDMATVASGSQGYRERIKATWLQHRQEGRAIQLTEIAADAEVGYSTVKKYAASIRAEIERQPAQNESEQTDER